MSATLQTERLDLARPSAAVSPVAPRGRRGLVPLKFVSLLCGVDEDGALALVESGQIPLAFNIARGEKIRELRVLADDVIALSVDRPCTRRTLEEALPLILPRPTKLDGADTVGASTVKRAFLCSQALIAAHIFSGQFKLATPRRSNGTHILLFSSVIEFLRRRLINTDP